MKEIKNSIYHPAFWKRALLGGGVILLTLAALVWIGRAYSAEAGFRELTRNGLDEQQDALSLTDLSARLGELSRRDPTNAEIRNLAASVLGRLGNYTEALHQLEIARKTLNTRTSLLLTSNMYEKMNDIAKAEAAMADCLLLNPADPDFNPARLHLLGVRLVQLDDMFRHGKLDDPTDYERYRREFGRAALNWGIRAANDKNAYLFLADYYIDSEFQFYLQAYRCFLVGFSRAPWLDLNPKAQVLINIPGAMNSIRQILTGRYAKQYRDLP